MALQIRDVPEDIRQALADRAAARGQSLQAFLLMLVTDEARRSGNLAFLRSRGFLRGLLWSSLAVLVMLLAYPLASGGFWHGTMSLAAL